MKQYFSGKINIGLKHVLLVAMLSSIAITAFADLSKLKSPKLQIRPVEAVPSTTVKTIKPHVYNYQAILSSSTKVFNVITTGISWQCQGNRCATSGPWPVPSATVCHALAQKLGIAVTSYGYGSKKLSNSELQRCNAGITVQAPVSLSAIGTVAIPKLKNQTIAMPPSTLIKPKSALLPSMVISRNERLKPATLPRGPSLLPKNTVHPIGADNTVVRSSIGGGLAGVAQLSKGKLDLNKPSTRPDGKSLLPPTGKRQLMSGDAPAIPRSGFVPSEKLAPKKLGLNKPVTGSDRKSLLPSGTAGDTRHLLHDGHTGVSGGFAAIPDAGSNIPVTSPSGTSLLPAQLKLTIDHVVRIDTHERMRLSGGNRTVDTVPLDSWLQVFLKVQNLGNESETVSVALSRIGYGVARPISVPPGEAKVVSMRVKIGGEGYGELLRAASGDIFDAGFKLVTADRQTLDFHDGNDRDNYVSMFFKITMPVSLVIRDISDVELTWESVPLAKQDRKRLHTHLKYVSVEQVHAKVIVDNSGTETSSPQTLQVKLESTQSASTPHNVPQTTLSLVAGLGNGVHGMQTTEISVPSIAGHSSVSVGVTFERVLHNLWQGDYHHRVLGVMKHNYFIVNAGEFACSSHTVNRGSAFKITVEDPVARRKGYITGRFNSDEGYRKCTGVIDGGRLQSDRF